MHHENEFSGSSLLVKFLNLLKEDAERGNVSLLVRGIPAQIVEQFEKDIISDPKHHGETVIEARDKEILKFMLRTIRRHGKKSAHIDEVSKALR